MNLQSSDFFTVAEAARALDVSPSTIWRWIEAERLPAYRLGPRSIRIRKQDLEAAIRPARAREEGSITRERPVLIPPRATETTKRKELIAEILAKRRQRRIAPMTAADLVRKARNWQTRAGRE